MDGRSKETVHSNQRSFAPDDLSRQRVGEMLARMTGYLLSVAEDNMPEGLRAKCGASDIVQESLLDAARAFPHYRGDNSQELKRWLRRILYNNIRDLARRYRGTGKRKLAKEQSLASVRPIALAKTQVSPSSHAGRSEVAIKLMESLEQLPDDQRRAIVLRNFDLLSFQQIGDKMDRSAEAARSLWVRAIDALRDKTELSDG